MIGFLLTTVGVSLSGVMAPGPITTATLAAGSRRRHAGAWLAMGHAVVEVPLILLLAAGAGSVLELPWVRRSVGLAGGVYLLALGVGLLRSARSPAGRGPAEERRSQRSPWLTGVVLTAANPYFLLWWATVGLALVLQAVELGVLVLALFVVVHWLCDLAWLEVLSWASHQGARWLGPAAQRWIATVCGVVLLGFGGGFLFDALGLSA